MTARKRALATVAAGAAVVLVGWVDYKTGPDIGFSLFYLVPVIVAAWRLGPGPTVVIACSAALVWFVADFKLRSDEQLLISAWNGFTRLAMYTFIGLLLARVRRDGARLRDLLERERDVSRTDSLTGLRNARAFVETLAAELSTAREKRHSLCVAYLDLDNFKRVNDLHGHVAGDALLRDIAAAIRSAVREASPDRAGDRTARLGGDEFAVLCWDVPREVVEGIGRRLLERVAELGRGYPGTGLGASVGIAYFDRPPADAEEVVRRADAAMYEAKGSGKGRVMVWTQTA